MEEWIPSTINQELMQSLKDELEVEWMFHVGIDIDKDTALPGTNAEPQRRQEDSVFNAPTIAIGRYFITSGKRDEFTSLFTATNVHLAKFVSPWPFLGAWRLDKGVTTVDDLKASLAGPEEGKEEFVLFTGWDDVTHHLRFAQSDNFQEFQRIRDSMDGAEIKHVVRLSLRNKAEYKQ
jgi:heme-degrading monooxygenase HmoA